MFRYLVAQLWRSRVRGMTLALGVLVAAVSFSLLTAAVQTNRGDLRGVVAGAKRGAYDILVRPRGTRTQLERESQLVPANFQSGIFGGISVDQWRDVLRTSGVQVAAPVANIGYVMPLQQILVPLSRFVDSDRPDQLFRLELTWSTRNSTARYADQRPFVYVTRRLNGCANKYMNSPYVRGPFDASSPSQSLMSCFELERDTDGRPCFVAIPDPYHRFACEPAAAVSAAFPLLIAAIDPEQESKLLGLGSTVTDGRALTERDTFSQRMAKDEGSNYVVGSTIPVMVSARTYTDVSLTVDVAEVRSGGEPLSAMLTAKQNSRFPNEVYRRARALPTTELSQVHYDAGTLYGQGLRNLLGQGTLNTVSDYWSVGPVTYQRAPDGSLHPRPLGQDRSVWADPQGYGGYVTVPPENADNQFRRLHARNVVRSHGGSGFSTFDVVGQFDPAKLPGFDARTAVPLATYTPPRATPADAATRRTLGGPYRPSRNLGGYLQQPPFILTTIRALPGLVDSRYFTGANAAAPISVIRVRVSGVTGNDKRSLHRVETVAGLIEQRTGLDVDVTAGSSPQTERIELPAGKAGTPPLALNEGWVRKGAVLVILAAVDRKSLLLLGLILLVTGVFLVNAGVAAVRSRRAELGTLLCLGWRTGQVFAVVLAELAVVGVAAGAAGTGLTFGLSAWLDLNQPAWRLALVAPISVGLALLAGLVPALLASRGAPLDVVRPPVRTPRRAPRFGGITGLGLGNLRRTPGRTVLAALALYVGVAALAVLAAISLAFRGAVVSTLLGRSVLVQVRTSDYVTVGLVLLLATTALADVLVLGMRERAVELVTLRVVGWSDRNLGRLVVTEGLGIGLVGAGFGALTGVAVGVLIGAPVGATVAAAAIALAIGLVLAALASVAPALGVARLPVGVASAEA